jgi:hypothetical protein
MDDGDALALEFFPDQVAGDAALLVVAAADAEDVPHVALGDPRIGGSGRDHQHAILLIHVGGGNGHAGIEVTNDELHAVGYELIGDRDTFLRVRAVVAHRERDLLPQNASGGVDVFHRLLDSMLELRAEGSAAASDRAGDAELDLRCGSAGQGRGQAKCQDHRGEPFHAPSPLVMRIEAGRTPRPHIGD